LRSLGPPVNDLTHAEDGQYDHVRGILARRSGRQDRRGSIGTVRRAGPAQDFEDLV
jgi:hypothetical protein